jgi:hypothetical protein
MKDLFGIDGQRFYSLALSGLFVLFVLSRRRLGSNGFHPFLSAVTLSGLVVKIHKT